MKKHGGDSTDSTKKGKTSPHPNIERVFDSLGVLREDAVTLMDERISSLTQVSGGRGLGAAGADR